PASVMTPALAAWCLVSRAAVSKCFVELTPAWQTTCSRRGTRSGFTARKFEVPASPARTTVGRAHDPAGRDRAEEGELLSDRAWGMQTNRKQSSVRQLRTA